MMPIGEKKELIFGREEELGYERPGNNGIVDKEASVLYKAMKPFYNEATGKLELPPQMTQMPGLNAEALTAMFNAVGKPYVEGAFMTKHNGTYYLQYACPAQYKHLRRWCVHLQVPAGTVHAASVQPVFLRSRAGL